MVRVSFAPAGDAGAGAPGVRVRSQDDGDNNAETLDQISVSALSLGEFENVACRPA